MQSNINETLAEQLQRDYLQIQLQRQESTEKIQRLNELQSIEELEAALNKLRSELGLESFEGLVTETQKQAALASLLTELQTIKQLDIPGNISSQFQEVQELIHKAIQGEEAANIEENLLKAVQKLFTDTGLSQELQQYQQELLQIELENQKDLELISKLDNDLQGATKQLLEAIAVSETLEPQGELLTSINLQVLHQVAYAQQAGDISESLAQQSREYLSLILEQRAIEREARKKYFTNSLIKVLAITASALALVGAVLTGPLAPAIGSAIGAATTTLNVIGSSLIAASGAIGAIQSAIQGDWLGAIYQTTMTIASFGIAVLPPGSESIVQALKVSKQVISTAYNSYNAFESDENLLGVLNIVQGVANIIATVNPSLISSANGLFDPVRLLLTAGQIANPTYFAIQTIQNGDILGGLSYLGQIATVVSHNFAQNLSHLSQTGLGQIFNQIPLDNFLNIFETVSVISNAIASDDIATWISAVTSGLNIWDDELKDFVNNHLNNNCECPPNPNPVQGNNTTDINNNLPDSSADLLNPDGSNLTDDQVTGNDSNSDLTGTSPSNTNSSENNSQIGNTGNQNIELQTQPLDQYYYDSQGNKIPISETNGLDANGNIIPNPETGISQDGETVIIKGSVERIIDNGNTAYESWLNDYIDSIVTDILAKNAISNHNSSNDPQINWPSSIIGSWRAVIDQLIEYSLENGGKSAKIFLKGWKYGYGLAISNVIEIFTGDYLKDGKWDWEDTKKLVTNNIKGLVVGELAGALGKFLITKPVPQAVFVGALLLGYSIAEPYAIKYWEDNKDKIGNFINQSLLPDTNFYTDNLDDVFWTKEKREEFLLNSNSGLLQRIDPVILDLNNNGIKLISLKDSNIFFDMDGDGYAENTGWVSAEDGILAVDINLDGTINNIEEIFSEKFGGNKFNSGIQALASFDSNKDGIINNQDTRFSEILLWQDLNQNGISESNELFNLERAGITSINLQNITVNTEYEGNKLLRVGSYTNSNGNLGLLGDAGLLVQNLGILTNNLDGMVQIQLENLANSLLVLEKAQNYDVDLQQYQATSAIGNNGNDNLYTSGTEAISIDGGDGNDTLTGGDNDDLLIGGLGADKLQSGKGNDLLLIDAEDQIIDAGEGIDTIIFTTSDSVNIDLNQINAEFIISNDGNDHITNSGQQNVIIDGGKGNDYLIGGAGIDWIKGGDGDDFLSGRFTNESLNNNSEISIIETGKDLLEGGTGNDQYFFSESSGNDLIFDNSQSNNDQLIFGEGILPSNLLLSKVSDQPENLKITLTNNQTDSIIIAQQFNEESGIEQFVFADGTKWSSDFVKQTVDHLTGMNVGQTLVGGDNTDLFNLGNNPSNSNLQDTILIQNFNPNQDQIQIKGNLDNYSLGSTPSGTGIYYNNSGQNELLAIIEGQQNLNLTQNYFKFSLD